MDIVEEVATDKVVVRLLHLENISKIAESLNHTFMSKVRLCVGVCVGVCECAISPINPYLCAVYCNFTATFSQFLFAFAIPQPHSTTYRPLPHKKNLQPSSITNEYKRGTCQNEFKNPPAPVAPKHLKLFFKTLA